MQGFILQNCFLGAQFLKMLISYESFPESTGGSNHRCYNKNYSRAIVAVEFNEYAPI